MVYLRIICQLYCICKLTNNSDNKVIYGNNKYLRVTLVYTYCNIGIIMILGGSVYTYKEQYVTKLIPMEKNAAGITSYKNSQVMILRHQSSITLMCVKFPIQAGPAWELQPKPPTSS